MDFEEKAKSVFLILKDVYGKSPWTLEQVRADLSSPETDYFFTYEEKEMVGFMSLQRLIGETELTNIAVKRSYQGKSYGKSLLGILDKESEPIFLEVRASNKIAQELYLQAGFREIGRRKSYYHEPVEDAIVMKK